MYTVFMSMAVFLLAFSLEVVVAKWTMAVNARKVWPAIIWTCSSRLLSYLGLYYCLPHPIYIIPALAGDAVGCWFVLRK